MRNITRVRTTLRDHRHVVASSGRIRVFVLGGIRVYRECLAQALSSDESTQVVGTGPVDAESLRSIAAAGPVEVVVEASVVRGDELVQGLAASAPDAKVVALGLSEPDHELIQCAEAGVAGYVPCEGTLADLRKTIRSVSQGEFPCSPKLAALIVKRMSILAAGHRRTDADPQFTSREAEIVALIGEGMSNKEIAGRLGIEVSTVKNHVHHILAKAHVTRRGQAAAQRRPLLPRLG